MDDKDIERMWHHWWWRAFRRGARTAAAGRPVAALWERAANGLHSLCVRPPKWV